MANYSIILTVEEDTALVNMGISNVEAYIKSICAVHISTTLDTEFKNSTKAEKEKMLKAK